MKKLVIATFAVAFAAVAQAATINWAITNVKEASASGSSVNAAAGSYSAYLFVTANSSDVTLTTCTKAVVLEALASAHTGGDWSSISSNLASLSATHGTNGSAGIWSGVAPDMTGFSSGSVTAFAVLFDASTITDAKNFYLLDADKTASFTSSTGMKLMSWGSQAEKSALPIDSPAGWTSIAPEPTSGLMMLLGMGVLALRRRRA